MAHLPMPACTYPPRWSDEESLTFASLTGDGDTRGESAKTVDTQKHFFQS